MYGRSERRRIGVMIAAFVVSQVGIIITDELGYEGAARGLRIAWLGLCAYTWYAPAHFRRMLARALGTVRLDPRF
jgi:hypothetical protein